MPFDGREGCLHSCTIVHTIEHVAYEWDPAKAAVNLRKHGVDFADAVNVLEDDLALTMEGPLAEEERCLALGRNGRSLPCSSRGLYLARRKHQVNLCASGDGVG